MVGEKGWWRLFSCGSGVSVLSGGEEWRWKTLLCGRCPFYDTAGVRASRGEDATGPLPHMLDCCMDSTGVGGPARLLHVGWLYCVKAA